MKKQFAQFLVRWALNGLGIHIASVFFSGVSYGDSFFTLTWAALILSVINALIKPAVVILSLPALLITLGIFSIVINGLMVYLAHIIYGPLQVSSFGTAILAGLVIGLVNYIVTRVFDLAAEN